MDESTFIAAVADDLEDETTWLVYADWLEEQGSVRGEYLRLVCEIQRLGVNAARHEGLVARLTEITREHVIEFPGDRHGRFATDRARGFMVGARLAAAEFAEHGHDVLKWSPIRALELAGIGDHAKIIAGCPDLARIRRLVVEFERQRIGSVTTVVRSPHLDNLRELVFHGTRVGRSTFEAVANLANPLRLLAVNDWQWRPEWLKLLAGRRSTSTLESLNLGSCEQLTDAHVPFFEPLLAMASLRECDLSGTSVSVDAIEHLRTEYDHVEFRHSSPLR